MEVVLPGVPEVVELPGLENSCSDPAEEVQPEIPEVEVIQPEIPEVEVIVPEIPEVKPLPVPEGCADEVAEKPVASILPGPIASVDPSFLLRNN